MFTPFKNIVFEPFLTIKEKPQNLLNKLKDTMPNSITLLQYLGKYYGENKISKSTKKRKSKLTLGYTY